MPAVYEGEMTMAQRNQRGWLKRESRTHGETWVLFFGVKKRG